MPRNNILPRRLVTSRHVQLPNGGVVFTKYERVNRHAIAPTIVRINRTYIRKIRPRQQRKITIDPRNRRKRRGHAGAGLDLATAIGLGRRPAAKTMISDATDYFLTAYKKIKNKITNRKVKAVMNTGIDDYLVNKGIDLIDERFN